MAMDDASPVAGPRPRRRDRRHARRASRSRLRRWLSRSAITLGVVVLLLAAGGAGYYLYWNGRITRVPAPAEAPVHGPTENILLIGNTSRCAASSIARYREECQNQHVNGVNSDVVLVAHLDGRTGKVSLLSIPRDTFVPGARSGASLCGGTPALTPGSCADKIDSGLVQGPDQLISAIEDDFGVPINHFVDLNFATFTNVVNALGGLRMDFPDRLVDRSSFLDITRTGCQKLNGTEALALVRSRHLYYFTKGERPNLAAIQAVTTPTGPWDTPDSGGHYDGSGDLGRIVRVHLFLKALAEQVAARGLGNPLTDNALVDAIAPNLTVDSGLSTSDMVHLVLAFHRANLGNAPELTLPTLTYGQAYTYDGAPYGDVIFPTEPQDQQVVDAFLGRPAPRLAPSGVTVSVIDGTDSPSATAQVAGGLRRLGYHVVPTTASWYVGPVAETTVLYGPGHLAEAEQVERSLSGSVVLGKGTPVAGAEVSVVVGSDLAAASPTAAPTLGTSGGHRGAGSSTTGVVATSPSARSTTSATTTSTSTTSPEAGTPAASSLDYSFNSASAAIEPWDSRACGSQR